jgi:hypothetical protein
MRDPLSWKSIQGSLIRCEISASYDWLGNLRVSAKGAIAVIILGLLLYCTTDPIAVTRLMHPSSVLKWIEIRIFYVTVLSGAAGLRSFRMART